MLSIIGDVAQWAAVVVIGSGLMVSWRRNGKMEARRQGVIEEKINQLENTINRNNGKPDKILDGLNEIKEHCAGVTAGFKARIGTLEKREK